LQVTQTHPRHFDLLLLKRYKVTSKCQVFLSTNKQLRDLRFYIFRQYTNLRHKKYTYLYIYQLRDSTNSAGRTSQLYPQKYPSVHTTPTARSKRFYNKNTPAVICVNI